MKGKPQGTLYSVWFLGFQMHLAFPLQEKHRTARLYNRQKDSYFWDSSATLLMLQDTFLSLGLVKMLGAQCLLTILCFPPYHVCPIHILRQITCTFLSVYKILLQ